MNIIGGVLRWLNPFHYWRLILGDNRKKTQVTIKFLNGKTEFKSDNCND